MTAAGIAVAGALGALAGYGLDGAQIAYRSSKEEES
jgi:hypothetical protein